MDILVKLLFLFLGVDLLAYGALYGEPKIFILGIVNSLILFYISGFFPENILEKVKLFFSNLFSGKKDLKDNKLLEKNKNKDFFKENDLIILLKEINRDYIIVLSFFIFLYSLLAKLIGVNLDINIYVSVFIFIFSFLFGYKNIIAGEIYLGKRKLKFIDFIFFASLFIFYIFFTLKSNLVGYEKILISSFAGFLFFILAKSVLGVKEINYKKYKPSLFYIYIILISGLIFGYNYFNIGSMYKDFYVGHMKIEKTILWEKTYITGKNVEYKIKKENGKFFIENDEKNIGFLTLEQAENYILSSEENVGIDIENKIVEASEEKTSTGEVEELYITDKTLIPFLLKDKEYLDDLYDSELEFENIDEENPNYKYYNVAYSLKMIKLDTDLTDKVKCQNYLAMLGMSEKWDMSDYVGERLFVKYYKEALKRGLVPKGCKNNIRKEFKWEYVQK